MAVVTCAALLAALAGPGGGKTFTLNEDCAGIEVRHYHAAPVTIDAAGHLLTGVVVEQDAGNVVLKGGVITAAGGEGAAGRPGYALLLRGARDVRVENMRFVRFNRGIVTDMAERITVVNSRFEMGQDGIIANGGGALDFSDNEFLAVSFRPTTCALGGAVEEGLSARDCKTKGGQWRDGWHQDAIQLRNGIVGVRVVGNKISGVQQGIGQMDASTDAPMRDIVVRDNEVSITGFHSITFGRASNVEIAENSVRQETGRKTVIRVYEEARVCGNLVMGSRKLGGPKC
ncbi:MAG: hypothetical protein ACMVO5_12945 [Polymorphobacter sp.]|uniref:hypothetical protein n=1 Tax=Polymorphobacter sp. TaxID=1909290 RepID=UPI003A882FB4